jgi:hypothetical protein
MKVTPELKRLLEEAAGEVAKWPKWKRSLDPIGDEGRENVQRATAGTHRNRICKKGASSILQILSL